jgi:hypothetical protein
MTKTVPLLPRKDTITLTLQLKITTVLISSQTVRPTKRQAIEIPRKVTNNTLRSL